MNTQHPFRLWRRGRELTLEQCAPSLGVTFQHLGNVEKGLRNPSVDLILAMETMSHDSVSRDAIADFHGLRFETGLVLLKKECVSRSGDDGSAAAGPA